MLPAPRDERTTDADIGRLQTLLAEVPPPYDPPDVSALDGFLCGLLLQPEPVAPKLWRPYVADLAGRAPVLNASSAELLAIVERRHRELRAAIEGRRWFDPWVFELEPPAAVSDSVLPWVAGFALAVETFDRLLALDDPRLREPLSLIYRHLPPADLEADAELRLMIESLPPPESLGDAVEDLVCAVLLLADVARPAAAEHLDLPARIGSKAAAAPRGNARRTTRKGPGRSGKEVSK